MTPGEIWARRQSRAEIILFAAITGACAAIFVFGPSMLAALLRWWA